MAISKYDHQTIEKKWQQRWEQEKVFAAPQNAGNKKQYVLDMFPYPSGDGLHVGHPEGYTATDIVSRYLRMNGQTVLHPMGWDAFGLPAENAAIKKKIHPRIVTEKNIKNFKRQIQSIGFSYDWDREINTTDPKYYKWTQWIFLQLFKKGLAYEKAAPIWWCPKDKTGLANEEVVNGCCERCGTPVERKMLRQWMLKITEYADRLLDGLEKLDWPEGIKALQRNWIGKSEGAEVEFGIMNDELKVKVFTTRPDTLFGATYLVLAPEHELVEGITTPKQKKAVAKYLKDIAGKSDVERTSLEKEKTGVFTGAFAVNPVNQEKIPVWIADYVLASYGTGAIMAVPGHDQRDLAFAQKYDLPVQYVVMPHIVDTKNPPRADKETKKRLSVQAIIYDPKTKKYLCLRWQEQPWTTFVLGGVESGEDPLTAVKREILEETGLTDIRLIKELGGPVQSEYFAAHKDENRIGTFTGFLFELRSDKQEELVVEEKAKHEIVWRSRDELRAETMTCSELPFWLENLDADTAYSGEGLMINSGEFDGMGSRQAGQKIVSSLKNQAHPKIQYKLRDWVFSRQRYWGEPIPLVHCPTDGVVPIPENDLPVLLPDVEKYEPMGDGESPLATITEWVNTTCPKCGGPAKRETNTMPQWAGSCWYYLRFGDPNNDKEFASAEALKAWLPVDLYVGGAEHAVLHLLYARFWHMALYDIGAIPAKNNQGESLAEPFTKLKNQGLILGLDGEKMSKSRGNVINPDEIIEKYGADTLRMYEMFMGPFEDAKPWDTNGIVGVRRFLDKVWRASERIGDVPNNDRWNKYAKQISKGIENFRFNTCVSDFMKWVNEWGDGAVSKDEFGVFLKLLSPFAPHMTEELWMQLGQTTVLATETWPQFDKSKGQAQTVTIAVQVMGKLRATLSMPVGSDQAIVEDKAEAEANVKKYLTGKPKKIIFVKDKLINFVV